MPCFRFIHPSRFPNSIIMGSSRKKTLEEQLKELQNTVATQAKELVAKDTVIHTLQKKKTQQKLIPRPKGEPGQRDGYNLRNEMKLRKDGLQRIVRAYANWHLPTGKSISDQARPQLDSLVQLIQKDVPYFKQFQGGWPIRAIIKQYLRNAGQKLRRDLREEAATANGGVAPANEDENSDTEDDDGEDDGGEEAEDLDMDDNDAEDSGINYDTEDLGMDEGTVNDINGVGDEEFPSDNSGVQLNTASRNVEVSDLEEPATPRHRQKDKENRSSDMIKIKIEKQTHSIVPLPPPASTSPKRKALDQGHHVNADKRRKIKNDVNAPPLANLAEFSSNTSAVSVSAPATCPSNYCNDLLPHDPSDYLLSLLAERKALGSAPGTYALTRKICQAIHDENRIDDNLHEARTRGWDLQINFADLPDRVLALEESILDLVCHSAAVDECPIWHEFLRQISFKVHAFSRSPLLGFSPKADKAARCGYFGPKGQAIIFHTINKLLDESVSDAQLETTISSLEDTPEQWDQGDPQHTLPTNAHFIHYILAPLAATLLISDDFKTDFASAHSIMLASSDYGDIFNFQSPPTILAKTESKAGDSLSSTGNNLPSPPSSKRAPAVPSSSTLKTTTLNNFPPPVVKKKHSNTGPQNTSSGDADKPAKAPKKLKQLVPQKTHGTRSKRT
ncbi:hypothetical protein K438DRAFT_2024063 [Mycena galopus ATCC 62051]|nr:hypothetical protein K438DRAFT_2024063 [Mycena galopus ATCC 62051]